MPVEIRELVIRATTSLASGEGKATPMDPEKMDEYMSAIIEECVRQVLSILEQKEAR